MFDLTPEALAYGEGLLARSAFPEIDKPVTCAVSGGADSLSLLILARLHGLEVTAVHVDHGLREESASEAAVVQKASRRFEAAFRPKAVHLVAGPDLEARARAARKQVVGPDALTGHTLDDQAETLLINLLRGTGVAGLGAMEPGGIHPILALRRAETVKLCGLAGLDPVLDPSNDDPRFVRNRVRHELLPLMADISQRDIAPLLSRTSERARQLDQALSELSEDLDPTNVSQLSQAPRALAAQALRRWLRTPNGHPPSQAELARVFDVVEMRAVSCQLSGGRQVKRTQGVLRVE